MADAEDSRPPEGPVPLSEVRSRINFVEGLLGDLGPQDEYLAAMLRNQRILLEQMANQGRITGGVLDDTSGSGGPLSDVQRSALPQDATGTVSRDINPNDTGPAIFELNGSVFYTIVRNMDKEEMQAGTAVRVIGENNQVTARGAASSLAGVGGGQGQQFFRYQGRLYRVPRVTEKDEDVKVANQKYIQGTRDDVTGSLSAGENKEFARIEPDANEFALLKYTNATNHSTVRYDYFIDDPGTRDADLSGQVPWATPPDLYEVSPDGFKLIEDFASLELTEESGNTSYNNVQGTLTGLLIEVQT